MRVTVRIITWIIALCYLYGALVHVLNILDLSGFEWGVAPLKWQILDVVYLLLDLLVVFGLIRRWNAGFIAFYVAAISQIILYTVFRDWITDVPAQFSITEAQRDYLDLLVMFHGVTIVLLTAALWAQRKLAGTP